MLKHLPVLLTVMPLAGAFLVPVFGRSGRGHRMALVTVAVTLLAAVTMLGITAGGEVLRYRVGDWPPPWGIELRVDALGALLASFFALVYLAVTIFAGRDIPGELNPASVHWYWSLLLLLLAGINGVVTAHDLFNLFVFTEVFSLAACGIISIRDRLDSLEAAIKYLILSAVAAGCILLGIALVYMVTGHLNLSYLAAELPMAARLYPKNVLAMVALLTTGFALKSALFPLHVWLPDAHSSAPSPSSALLSGLVVKVGIVALIRLFTTVFTGPVIAALPVPVFMIVMAVGGIIFGALFAMTQRDLKRMLAYSTVTQVGYIYLGFGLLNETALTGALLHIINHALLKSMLFMCAGLFIHRTGKRRIADMAGLARHMPLTMSCFTIGAMAMVGIPVTNGFVSKWHLVLGTLHGGQPLLAGVILLSSLLSSIYYFPVVVAGWFGHPASPPPPGPEGPPSMVWPIVALASLCLILGVWPHLPLRLLGDVARTLLGR
ncbi:MAG: proton-conducting transporter membrane subunit [bacterium]|nr:proton-conducting transporter membrane subunit [bacterium]